MGRIEGKIDGACLENGQHRHQDIEGRQHADRHPRVPLGAIGEEKVRQLVGPAIQLRECEGDALKIGGDRVWSRASPCLERTMHWLRRIGGVTARPVDGDLANLAWAHHGQTVNGNRGMLEDRLEEPREAAGHSNDRGPLEEAGVVDEDQRPTRSLCRFGPQGIVHENIDEDMEIVGVTALQRPHRQAGVAV